jgi:hypothetical protein
MVSWLDGYQDQRPPRIADPPRQLASGWLKGQRRQTVEVVCCEACGSLNIAPRTQGNGARYWHCKDCMAWQKEAPTTGMRRLRG